MFFVWYHTNASCLVLLFLFHKYPLAWFGAYNSLMILAHHQKLTSNLEILVRTFAQGFKNRFLDHKIKWQLQFLPCNPWNLKWIFRLMFRVGYICIPKEPVIYNWFNQMGWTHILKDFQIWYFTIQFLFAFFVGIVYSYWCDIVSNRGEIISLHYKWHWILYCTMLLMGNAKECP